MRPRRARLGCSAVVAEPHVTKIGFNEAEARAPRMLPATVDTVYAAGHDFNEAEARAPRMLRSHAWAIASDVIALQ